MHLGGRLLKCGSAREVIKFIELSEQNKGGISFLWFQHMSKQTWQKMKDVLALLEEFPWQENRANPNSCTAVVAFNVKQLRTPVESRVSTSSDNLSRSVHAPVHTEHDSLSCICHLSPRRQWLWAAFPSVKALHIPERHSSPMHLRGRQAGNHNK